MEEKVFITDGKEVYEVVDFKLFDELTESEFALVYKELSLLNDVKTTIDNMVTNGLIEVMDEEYNPNDMDLTFSLKFLKDTYVERFGNFSFEKLEVLCRIEFNSIKDELEKQRGEVWLQ